MFNSTVSQRDIRRFCLSSFFHQNAHSVVNAPPHHYPLRHYPHPHQRSSSEYNKIGIKTRPPLFIVAISYLLRSDYIKHQELDACGCVGGAGVLLLLGSSGFFWRSFWCSSGVLLVFFWCSSGFFWVLLAFFWRSSGVLLAFDNAEERQKNARRTQKNPEEPRRTPEEHQKNTRRTPEEKPPPCPLLPLYKPKRQVASRLLAGRSAL